MDIYWIKVSKKEFKLIIKNINFKKYSEKFIYL